jgi:hypothetical protein
MARVKGSGVMQTHDAWLKEALIPAIHMLAGALGRLVSKNRRMSSVWRFVPVFAKMRSAWVRAVAAWPLVFALWARTGCVQARSKVAQLGICIRTRALKAQASCKRMMPGSKEALIPAIHMLAGALGRLVSKNRRMSSVWRFVPVFAKMRSAWVRAVARAILSRSAAD